MTGMEKEHCAEHAFNSGFLSALGRFVAHAEMFHSERKLLPHDLRIYAAADHLFDLAIPAAIQGSLRGRIEEFRAAVLARRLDMALTWEEGEEIFRVALTLLEDIDREAFGVTHICCNWP